MPTTTPHVFKLTTKEDVEKFEQYLAQYLATFNLHLNAFSQFSLVELFNKIQNRDNKERLFSLAEEIKLYYCYLFIDLKKAGDINHSLFSVWGNKNLADCTILANFEKFHGKIEQHGHYISFVFKYRAIGDKLMGFLILYYGGIELYKRFCNAKSRKRFFRKHNTSIPQSLVDLPELFEKFDANFRTAEAHSVSQMKKRNFSTKSQGINGSQVQLSNYWSHLQIIINSINNSIN